MNRIQCLSILGLDSNASLLDIKSAYRRLAMKYHPDRNSGDKNFENKFKEINKAYKLLINNDFETNTFNKSSNFNFADFDDLSDSFGDIFGDIFGEYNFDQSETRSKDTFKKSKDSYIKVELNLIDAANGYVYGSFVPYWVRCNGCLGKKYKNSGKQILCPKCKGTGFIKTMVSFISIKQPCNECNGYGRKSVELCTICNGLGKSKTRQYITVNIPKGVTNSFKIKVSGKGELYDLDRNLYGNLYLDIYLKKDKVYTLDNDLNVHFNLDLNFVDILKGGTFIVKTLYGAKSVIIKSCVNIYNTIILRNSGYYLLKSDTYSDFIVHIKVNFPSKINTKQRILLDEFK